MPSPVVDPGMQHHVTTYTRAEAAPHHMMRPLNDADTILYENSFGGGGVATGLLLGPLGVAANVKSIRERTEREAAELYGKLAVDAQALLNSALADSGLALAAPDGSSAALIKPALDVVSLDGERLGFAVTIMVDHHPAGKDWLGRYLYQLDASYPRSEVAAGLSPEASQTLEQQAAHGMSELVRLYLDDAAGKLKDSGKVKFRSDFLTTRIKFKMEAQSLPSAEGRFVARTPNTVVSLPQDQVQIER
jgi:hypothetical protein